MSSHVRVGDQVYLDGKAVATHMRGAWYKFAASRMEWDVCDSAERAVYDGLIDVSTLPQEATQGEHLVVDQAKQAIQGLPREDKDLVIKAVKSGLIHGIRKYGPYDPTLDKRDLLAWMEEELRDAIVYGSMELTKRPNKHISGAVGNIAVIYDLVRKVRGAR